MPKPAVLALNTTTAAKRDAVAALCFALDSQTQGSVPPTLTLVPAPDAAGRVTGIDGRSWKLTDAARVAARFTRPLSITENHAGRLAAPRGESSPAFGWIESLMGDGGVLMASVRWTPRGEQALKNLEYRYLSPEFLHDAATGEITEIVGASLTNDPNFPQLALNAVQAQPHPETERVPMFKMIALALGLAETADEAAVCAAIEQLKKDKTVALNSAQNPDAAQFVPRAQYDLALGRATTAETALNARIKAETETAITTALDEAQKSGKIAPAAREYFLTMCRKEGGLEEFRKFVALTPAVVATTETGTQKPPEQLTALNAEEKQVAALMGVADDKYLAEKNRLRAAGHAV